MNDNINIPSSASGFTLSNALYAALRAVKNFGSNSYCISAFQHGKRIIHMDDLLYIPKERWKLLGIDRDGTPLWYIPAEFADTGTQWFAKGGDTINLPLKNQEDSIRP